MVIGLDFKLLYNVCVFHQALDHVSSTGRPLESASDHLTEIAMQERYLFVIVTALLL